MTAAQTPRKQADAQVAGGHKPSAGMSASEMSMFIHASRIHQIELEMQNEELRDNQNETERMHKACQDPKQQFPDFATMVYQCSNDGDITRIKGAVADALGSNTAPQPDILAAKETAVDN